MTVETGIAARRPELSAAKQALLEQRLRGALKAANKPPRIARRLESGRAPLSFAQQRLWFFSQLEPNSPLYNLPTVVRLRGRLYRGALEKALTAIVARHEALRARFVAEDGNPVQVIGAPVPVELPVIELSRTPGLQREAELRRVLQEQVARPFDLSCDLPMRAVLVELGPAEHVLALNLHHIVSDAWSMSVFFRELALFYGAFGEGRNVTLPELPIQYTDYAVWQREWMQGEVMERQLDYWKRHLAGAPHVLELPADRPRPAIQTFRGGRAERILPAALLEEVRVLGHGEGATLFMTLLAAFKVLLYRYTRQVDPVVGSPIACRNQLETEGLIGFFVNTLALHTDLSGDPAFRKLLARVRQVTLDGYAHQDLPFEQLVEELQPQRSARHAPLVQVMFVLQTPLARGLELPGLTVAAVEVDTGTSKFDLTLAVEERADGLLATVEYNSDLFDAATADRILQHFQTLLEGIVANPAQSISRLPLLTDVERHQVLVEWNDTRTDYPRDKTLPELFEEQVEKTPEATAVDFAGQRLTYRELAARANQLAHRLQALGVQPDAPVALCMERSLELIVGLLGILKAGGAYMSLDPAYPPERMAFMLADAQAPVLLTGESLRGKFNFEIPNLKRVCLDAEWKSIAQEPVSAPAHRARAENLAYVSFTSGSTGRPKGVCVPHRAVARLVRQTNFARFGPDERFLQLSPVAFDASTLEIWGALLNGGQLVMFPPHTPSLAELGGFIRQHGVTTLWLTAGLFHQMVEEQFDGLKTVRQLLAGGDVLSVPHVQKVLAELPGCHLINGYGPTENTTFTCCHRITAPLAANRTIPIGKPIANTQVCVLDERLQPLPVGVPGELYAAGDGLARGYLNRPELTAEKFIPHPFSDEPGARLYNTGDLVRWLPDGSIEFFGRADQQVKIRGFRVELGEIETVLGQHAAVKECVVTTREEAPGSKRLIAYLVARQPPAPAAGELRGFLQTKLPDYMLPSAFVFLEALPLSPNGKVDRRALPAPDDERPKLEKKYVAPRDSTELQLAQIWEDVLGIRPIGVTDHFFDLGGHSLLAVRVVARIDKAMGKQLPVASLFQSPTIERLAAMLRQEGQRGASLSSIVEIQPAGSQPPLFFIHGVGGGMFWGYTNLSRHLGADQPVYAFKSRGMDGREELGSLEEMAAHYAAELRACQPRGPYFLGGYCFGGNVAFEMARQLQARGQRVALLALMNSAPTNSRYTRVVPTPVWLVRFVDNLRFLLACYFQRSAKQQADFIAWQVRTLVKKLARGLGRSRARAGVNADEVVDLTDYPAEQRRLWEVHIRALFEHHTQSYPGHVTLFRSRGHPLLCSFDRTYGWNEFAAGGVTVKIVPGAHEKILEEPHVQVLARELKACLSEAHTAEMKGRPA